MVVYNGIDVTINNEGSLCTEYEHGGEATLVVQDDQETKVRYIEAIAGMEFAVSVSANQQSFSLRRAEAISVQVIIDGDEQAFALAFKKDGYRNIIRGRDCLKDGKFFEQKFFFENLSTCKYFSNVLHMANGQQMIEQHRQDLVRNR